MTAQFCAPVLSAGRGSGLTLSMAGQSPLVVFVLQVQNCSVGS